MLESIDKLTGEENIGGGDYLLFVDYRDVLLFPSIISGNISTAITLKAGKDWNTLRFTEGTLGFFEVPVEENGNEGVQTVVEGVIPKDRITILNVLKALKITRCVLIYINNNGDARVLGTPTQPAKFYLDKLDHKKQPSERNEYFIGFTVTQADHAPFYLATIPTPGGGGGGGSVTITVNGSAWAVVSGPATENIQVVNDGLIPIGGNYIPGYWVVNPANVTNSDLSFNEWHPAEQDISIGDVTITIKNSSGTTIASSVIPGAVSRNVTAPNTPIKNSAGTLIFSAPSGVDYNVGDDTVRNSDSSYVANDVVQGVVKILPDVNIYARNSALTTVASTVSPSVKDVTLDIGDSNVRNSDSSYSVNVPAEQNHVLPDITVEAVNSELTVLGSGIIPSCQNASIPLTDIALDYPDADIVSWPAGKDLTITRNVIEITTIGATAYTTPSNLLFAHVACIGGGGGGGSGRKGAASTNRSGGSGASAGTLARKIVKPSEIGSGVTVTVGSGGTGGAAQTTNSTNGNAGSSGGSSSFGSLVVAPGGSGGSGGGTGTITGGAGISVSSMTPNYSEWSIPAIIGGSSGTGNGSAGSVQSYGLIGAPGGGGINSSNTQGNGAAGSTIRKNDGTLSTAATAGNASTPTPAGNGLDNQLTNITPVYPAPNTIGLGSSGASGYGNRVNSGGENWNGGNGGLYGGAGGGGGAGEDGATDSGKGGDGGQGAVIIIEYLIS